MIDEKLLLSGDRRTLAKAITLIESSRDEDRKLAQDLLEKILPHTGKSFRLGITGVPGVGKSTFIESFGQLLISKGHKVAVLAVDPSSPLTGGSIMGDKTRMEKLSAMSEAFIRPSPTAGALGGVANKTRETMLLCEAAGFDYVLVETVGVGQSEYEVQSMVDFFMVLMLPNAGDELQGIKKGILELADAIVVNKADGDMADQALRTMGQYQSALELISSNTFWKPFALTCSSLKNDNIQLLFDKINEFQKLSTGNNHFLENRGEQNKAWFKKLIHELLELKLNTEKQYKDQKMLLENSVMKGELPPLKAAHQLIDGLF
ncbi:MAG: methylmalonyl Co-A mutase-associated GTPase MeaB [Bacteriovorax sp.]|jgi:LAO/AO transport system kinase|nr:methylmalonyl Co-A mutase-associated GTPase MeaB [Bacteriovorax sp.]